MIKKVLLIFILLFELYCFKVWLACVKMQDLFHFSPYDAQLKTEFQIGNDVGYSPLLARYFHNKISIYVFEIFSKYFSFWGPNFGALYFSFIGYFGILLGFYYLFMERKNIYKLTTAIVLLLLPLINVFDFHIPFKTSFILLTIPYYLFSIYGLWKFVEIHKKYGLRIILILAVLSVWYFFIFQKDIFTNFCYNI